MKVSKWAWRWQAVDYGLILPLMARLPYRLAQCMSNLRGSLHAQMGRDWAELSVGIRYIAARTLAAAQQLWPQLDARTVVQRRYQSIAREEWHANLLSQGSLKGIYPDLTALQTMLTHASPHKGLVVLTAHFDSFIVGMVGLGLCGRKTSITVSNIYEHPQVHPSVTAFFKRKYRGAEKFLMGGQFLQVETSMKALYRALQRKETVVVVADAPGTLNGNGAWVPFFGRTRKVANGGFRMAMETNSLICAMLSVTNEKGEVSWICSEVLDPDLQTDFETRLFHFFETQILAWPGRWWASHLLEDYPVQPGTECAGALRENEVKASHHD
jgi:hypothetical protein